MSETKNAFDVLYGLDVNSHTEKKKSEGTTLTYLSWTWAWAEVKKRFPDASYTVWRDERGLPYSFDPATGYMVFTSVTIDGVTHEMWLPVMNSANKAMRAEPYEYSTKYSGKKRVEAATMFDINKTLMRCLTKNLAMFGLGLYIYAGEDLPEDTDDGQQEAAPAKKPTKKAEPKPEPKAEPKAVPKREEPQQEPEKDVKCELCGLKVTGISGKGGAWVSQDKVIQLSQKRHGKNLCAACQRTLATAEPAAQQ